MPTFSPGAAKVATLSVPVSPSGLSCTAELFLTKDGVTKVATSGPVSFTSTGAAQNISLSITMPSVNDTYMVYIDIITAGALIEAYQATENVIVAAAAYLTVLAPPNLNSFWGVQIYDPVQETEAGKVGATSDIANQSFILKSKDFMLVSDYYPGWPIGYPWQYGPYKVIVPDWGNYTFDTVNQAISGGGVLTNLQGVSKSKVTAVISQVLGYPAYAGIPSQIYAGSGKILSSTPYAGFQDIGKYLIGISVPFWIYSVTGYTSPVDMYNMMEYALNKQIQADLTVKFWDPSLAGASHAVCYMLSNVALA